jgi:hypothetical protein
MEYRTDESGPQPPGQEAGAGPAAQAAGPAGQAAGPESPVRDAPTVTDGLARQAGERPAVTGEPRVDAALARLDELPELPVTEHRAVFEHVHKSLTDVLGELDAGLPAGAPDTANPRWDAGAGGSGAGKADRHRG